MVVDKSKILIGEKQTPFFEAIFDDYFKVQSNSYNEFAIFGGWGCGKSHLTILCTILLCKSYPGLNWVFIKGTYRELKDTVVAQFLEDFPPSMWGYRLKVGDMEFHFDNGSVIRLRAFDTPDKILSSNYSGVTFCQAEQASKELYLKIIGRMRNIKSGIPKNISILEGNPEAGWCKDRFIDNPVPGKTFFLELTSFDNPHLPRAYIERMIAEYPESWVQRYIYGSWENLDEMVLSSFKEKSHVIEPVSFEWIKEMKGYQNAAGADYGFLNPSAFIWGFKDYDGRIVIYDEFYKTRQSIPELSDAGKRHGPIPIILDYSTKIPMANTHRPLPNELSKPLSIWDELSFDLNLIPSNKDKMRNINGVNVLFQQNRLLITRNCVNLIREVKNWKWQREEIGKNISRKEKPVDKDDHAIDAMLYLVSYLEDMKALDPSIIPFEKTLMGMVQRKENTRENIFS